MVNAFAALTSDVNSLHLNEEIARKSRFRTRIVHGMLPFSMLAFLAQEFPNKSVQFISFHTRFLKAIHYNQTISITIDYFETSKQDNSSSQSFDFTATISKLPHLEKVTEIKGCFDVHHETSKFIFDHNVSRINSLLTDKIIEEQHTLNTLTVDSTESLSFYIDETKLSYFISTIIQAHEPFIKHITLPSTNLIASLLLSTIVGMKIPGRHATFSSFKLKFINEVLLHKKYKLKTSIKRISKASEVIKTLVSIECENQQLAEGEIESLVNPPPTKMLSCFDITQSGLNDLGLKGKVALITGSSRGIGETTAKLLSMLGCKVIITYYKGKNDAQIIATDIKTNGGEALVQQCDVTNEESVKTLYKVISEKIGDIDILINNAVKDFSASDIELLNWDDFLGELEVTLKGTHLCCKYAIPAFKRNNRGKIINLSTIAVANPPAGQAKYISAKSALEGYTKSLAKDLVKNNIQANIVVPNMAETDLVTSIPSAYRHKIAQSRPYGRHVKPIEIAQSIAFLASPWSDAITGQKIVLNLGEPPFA
ncbi:3-oxoacyl-[acyl-carrier protein] reductase [hydrothermal vent metagenome]|uniref:3-oxoacyl-[acyl-carrier protein] reductase n=1 Tax=hydrothermal vent metagenome TaxID=652676 RepID=A0A3B0Z1L9_9ZZZZ